MLDEQDVLGRQDNLGAINTRSLRRAHLKISHLEDLNRQLLLQVEVFRKRVQRLDELVDNLTEFNSKKQNIQRLKLTENGQLIEQIIIENKELFYKCQEIIQENQELINQKLIREQIHEEAIIQYEVTIDRYQKKIHEIRQWLQIKQGYIQDIQILIKKDVDIQIPATIITNTAFFDKCIEPYVYTIQKLYQKIRNYNPSYLNEEILLGAQKIIELNKNRSIKGQEKRKSFFEKSYLSDFRMNNQKDQPNNLVDKNEIGLFYFNTCLQLKKSQKQLTNAKIKISELKTKQKTYKQSNLALSDKVQKLTNQLTQIKAKQQAQAQKNKNNKVNINEKKQMTAETISSFQSSMNEFKCHKNNFKELSCSITLVKNNDHLLKKQNQDKQQKQKQMAKQNQEQKQKQGQRQGQVQKSCFDLRQEELQQIENDISLNKQSGFLSNIDEIYQSSGQKKYVNKKKRSQKAAQHFIQENLFD